MFNFIKNLFHKFFTPGSHPVTRLMVLKKAKELKRAGLCYSIQEAMAYYGLSFVSLIALTSLFPLFIRTNARRFGANCSGSFWWVPRVWDTGREDFLDWLIEQYRDDKTDLRTLG